MNAYYLQIYAHRIFHFKTYEKICYGDFKITFIYFIIVGQVHYNSTRSKISSFQQIIVHIHQYIHHVCIVMYDVIRMYSLKLIKKTKNFKIFAVAIVFATFLCNWELCGTLMATLRGWRFRQSSSQTQRMIYLIRVKLAQQLISF